MVASHLVLDSLQVRGFRVFRELTILRLGRVNLITGKNNVGKSCLLEALRLYARRAQASLIWEMLEARDESEIGPGAGEDEGDAEAPDIRHLFYGRRCKPELPPPIQIGPVTGKDQLSLAMELATLEEKAQGFFVPRPLLPTEYALVDHPILVLRAGFGEQEGVILRFDRYRGRRPMGLFAEPTRIPCSYVPANGLSSAEIGELWDGIALTPMEEVVLESLRIIAPDVDRVTLVAGQSSKRERIPIAKPRASDDPVPLRSMGEGMNRMLGIALALVNAKDGMLLIDEVESGLHYSVEPELWRLVFRVAARLNVQVFSTTHNWDCIRGFQKAARESPEDGLLISLRRKEDKPDLIVPILYSEEDLAVATQETIEVR
jgi:hypothetical protein